MAALALAALVIAGQSPTAAAQSTPPKPALDCIERTAAQGGDTVRNACDQSVQLIGTRPGTANTEGKLDTAIAASGSISLSAAGDACVQYAASGDQQNSGYQACPDNDNLANYDHTQNPHRLAGASKLDAGFRDLPASALPVAEGGENSFDVRLTTSPEEQAGDADVTVTLTPPTGVRIDTDKGTAGDQTTLTFTGDSWGTAQAVYVFPGEDEDAADNDVMISLSAAGGGSGDYSYAGVTGSVSLAITDDDAELVLSRTSLTVGEGDAEGFSVKLKGRPSATVTVTLTQPSNADVSIDTDSGTAGNQDTLTFSVSNWDDDQTVRVSAAEDDDSAHESARIALSAEGGGFDGALGSVDVGVDDDEAPELVIDPEVLAVEEGRAGTFTVRLSKRPEGPVTVTLQQPSNTDVTISTGSDSQNTLTFTGGDGGNWDTPQSVAVRTAQDGDIANESASITLSAAGGGFDGVAGSVTVNVADDDVEERGLIVSGLWLIVDEGGSDSFSVQLATRPDDDVTVTLTQPRNPDVTLDTDAHTPGNQDTLDFTLLNWNAPQWITVSAVQDDDKINDQTRIDMSASGGGYSRFGGVLFIQVADDESPQLVVAPNPLRLAEGGSGAFTVRLEAQPSADVTVTLAQPFNPDVTLDADVETAGSQIVLKFTAENWSTAQSVQVSAAHDRNARPDSASITLSAEGGGYTDVRATLTVRVADDEADLLERERATVRLLLAEVVGGMLSSTRDAIGLRWNVSRSGRVATAAGRSLALDRSLADDLAAGFAERAGARGAPQGRFARDRFGAERHSPDWLGGVPLQDGRPLRPAGGRASSAADRSGLISGFSYALGLDAGTSTGWSVWGRSTSRDFSGAFDDTDAGEFEGVQSGTWFGIDRRSDGGVLSGLAHSSSTSDIDYTMGALTGRLEAEITAVLPYIEIAADNGATGRMMMGFGSGEATLVRSDRVQGAVDLSMYLLSLAGSWPTAEFGNSTLSLSGDLGYSALEPDDHPTVTVLKDLNTESARLRAGVELMHNGFGNSWTATPRIALLLRHDAGDGAVGSGVEVAAGMQILSTSERLSLDFNVRALASHSAEDYSDSSSSIQLRLNTRTDGMGFALGFGPHWGSAEGDALRDGDALAPGGADRQRSGRGLAADIAYGLRALGGVLTPYSKYRISGAAGGSIRQTAGVRFSGGGALQLSLFGERLSFRRGETRSQLSAELRRLF